MAESHYWIDVSPASHDAASLAPIGARSPLSNEQSFEYGWAHLRNAASFINQLLTHPPNIQT